ncbi:hypothetical protein M3Y96_00481300 [Aphelenchoides besseyi]|nr:hypothetical protein M3Y96_00481300 [Aphelenchoides besseyi]
MVKSSTIQDPICLIGDGTTIPFVVWPILLSLVIAVLFAVIVMNGVRLYAFLYAQQQILHEFIPLMLKTADTLGQDTKFIETKHTTYVTQEQDPEKSKKDHVTKKLDD